MNITQDIEMNTCRRTTKISDNNPAFAMRELHELYHPEIPIDEEYYYQLALSIDEKVEVTLCARCKAIIPPTSLWCINCIRGVITWENLDDIS